MSDERGTPGFFRLRQVDGRWWLITPDGHRFWSIGMNHIDAAAIRFPVSRDVWQREYQNSQEKWLASIGDDLRDWGFNTIGWTQEVVIITDSYHRHSRPFTFEEYQWAGMPYCHLLPFTEAHQWQVEVRQPDLMSSDFEEWCDYVARDQCARMRDDPKLIGYFYCDCPQWVHSSEETAWRGSLADPEWLNSKAGKRRLAALAQRYYQVTRDAIRRYDRNHLILGDRWEANRALPEEVILAALPYVDVLSFQCFGSPANIESKMRRWARLTQRPVLLADAAGWKAGPDDLDGWPPSADRNHDAEHYRRVMDALLKIPQCVGYHLCGAHIRNNARRYGFRDEHNRLVPETAEGIRTVNDEVRQMVNAL